MSQTLLVATVIFVVVAISFILICLYKLYKDVKE